MKNQGKLSLALLAALALGCGDKTTMSVDLAIPMDMAKKPQDMSMQPPDMTVLPDLYFPSYNGCSAPSYVDDSAPGATRTVTFPSGADQLYVPKCMLIAAGQTVTWMGSFTTHPLVPGVGSFTTAGSPNNPIMLTNSSSTVQPFTFSTPGFYPFHCNMHDSMGMNGVIQVK